MKVMPASENVTLDVITDSQVVQFAWAQPNNGCDVWETIRVNFTAASTTTTLKLLGSIWGDVAVDDITVTAVNGENWDFEIRECTDHCFPSFWNAEGDVDSVE